MSACTAEKSAPNPGESWGGTLSPNDLNAASLNTAVAASGFPSVTPSGVLVLLSTWYR
jgi:hypothetical protein